MKKRFVLATALGLLALGAHAHADHQPATAALGAGAAHLAAAHASAAQPSDTFTLRYDPSGAAMCFDAAGSKAPLSACNDRAEQDGAKLEHILAFDPTGAPMCFDLAGTKAPLSACGPTLEAREASGRAQLAAR